MKTKEELHRLVGGAVFARVDAHLHTHLCDGKPDMTVENVARTARERGMELVILTPHFHRQVQDDTATLYTDTDEGILLRLREEIETEYAMRGRDLTILLSTEADILSVEGETALRLSPAGEEALDLVTPTVNYHPLLPLKAVEVTYGRCIAQMHGSGLYSRYAERIGGVERVLETLYETEANAILRSPYPAMLGHFLAAHAYAVGPYNWFGTEPKHLDLMKEGASRVLDACAQTGAMVDLTGIHCGKLSDAEKRAADGFLHGFQTWFIAECRRRKVIAVPGSDGHGLGAVGDVAYYRTLL